MTEITPKKRLLDALNKKQTDRPPVICMGGMMNASIVEVMNSSGYALPAAHDSAELMVSLAGAIQQQTGFENLGVPFCMTVEAELLGSTIDKGTLSCEPKIVREAFGSVEKVVLRDIDEMIGEGRIHTVTSATGWLAEKHAHLPVIVSMTGPVSTAASIVDPMTFYKQLRKNPAGAHRVLEYVTALLIRFAEESVKAGATVIAIGDPSATGEILGPAMFQEYAVRYLNILAEAVHGLGTPVILHICGNIDRVRYLVPELRADALSTDAMVNLAKLKEEYPEIITMGNLSTYALEWSTPGKIADQTKKLVDDGIDIISPACGLSTSTTVANIRAMTGAVHGG
ncbi:MAG TPA: uroporphyrinogen decarboxylase family protein [Chlorobaculum sp.]|nr:uroporphyrinogen decarboxylase family protein [Chlorobaculum sp.]